MISVRSARAVTAGTILLLMAAGAGCTPARRDNGPARMPPPPPPAAAVAPTEPPPVAPTGALLVYRSKKAPNPNYTQTLHPIDPATGGTVAGYEPLALGYTYTSYPLTLSPDGRILAFATFTLGQSHKLRLFHLDTWAEAPDTGIEARIDSLFWSPDGTRLHMFGGGGATMSHLRIVDLQGAEPRLRAEAEIPFVVERTHTSIAPDGNMVYTLGYILKDPYYDNITAGAPFLVAIDAATGRERARLELPDVKIGLHPLHPYPDEYAGIRGTDHDPGLAMSPDGRRYYVAHPDENAITVVNLETMAVERTVNPAREASLWERLRAPLEKPARAKGFIYGGLKDLLVSPDGRWLYALGSSIQVVPVGEGSFGLKETATGVQVIDTETMREVARLAAGEARYAALSPDGRHLYVTGQEPGQEPPSVDTDGGQGVREGIGLMVYETGAWKLVSHLTPGANYWTPVPSADGRFVYLFDGVRPEGAAADQTRTRLTVVATGDWTVRSERIMDEHPYCIMAGPGRCLPW